MWHKAPLQPHASRVLSAMSSKAPPQCSRVVTGTCNHMFTGARRARTWDNQVEDYSTIFPQTLKKGKLQFLAYGLSWQRKLFRGGAGAEAGGEDADSSRWRYSSWQRAFLPQSVVDAQSFPHFAFRQFVGHAQPQFWCWCFQTTKLLSCWIDTNSPLRKENLSFWSSLPRFQKRREFSPTNLTLET